MSLERRLARLEHQPVNEGRLAARAEAVARAHDLPLEAVLAEAAQFFRLTPAERARQAAGWIAAGLLDDDDPACADHGGPPCGATLRALAERSEPWR